MKNLFTHARQRTAAIALLLMLLNCMPVMADTYFTVAGIRYVVKNISDKECSVTFIPYGGNDYEGAIKIPSQVTYDGRSYTVTGIGNAFDGSDIIYVSIPNTVTSIETDAFDECFSLKSINVDEGNSVYSSIDGILYSKDKQTLITVPNGVTDVNIPSSVTSIIVRSFGDCYGLKSINVDEGNSVYSSIDGILYSKDKQTIIIVPKGVTDVNIPSSITTIRDNLFFGCTGLTSITIPNSVTSIGSSAFDGCTSLKSINVDEGNSVYSSIDGILYSKDKQKILEVPNGVTDVNIPSSVTSICYRAFEGCTRLTSITIPNSVTSIDNGAFYGCTGLTSITIPNSVTRFGTHAFYGCTGLTSITIPNSVTEIYLDAFNGCTGLTSITIPNSVTEIGLRAFRNCTSLTSIIIPNSVTSINTDAFDGCSLDYLLIQGTLSSYNIFSGLSCSAVFVPEDQLSAVEYYWKGALYSLSSMSYELSEIQSYPTSISFKIFENPTMSELFNLQKVEFGGDLVTPDANGLYVAKNLRPNYTYKVKIYYDINGDENLTKEKNVRTSDIATSIGTEFGQTYVKCKMSLIEDPSGITPQEYGLNSQKANEDGYVTIKDLKPNTKYDFTPYVKLDDGTTYYGKAVSFTTKSLSPSMFVHSYTTTTISVEGTYSKGDAEVSSTGFKGYETDGTHLNLTGLDPGKYYTLTYFVRTKGGFEETYELKVHTSAIEWETLPAKATSNTVALICANTNIDEEETGTGFEWRRYDAPDLVPSTQAPCPVVDGTLTGALKNLSASTYYKFRPYYKSASGNMYYGDWLAFGTADAYVYFDPTVRTYEATEVGDNSAKVKGFAIGGSDDITEQGFEYWKTAGSSASPKRVPVKAVDNDGTQSVIATGQWMTATLNDLAAGTTYSFRAYVKTANGITYGEEMNFTTTGVATAIGEVEEAQDVVEVARYTIDGRRIQTPQRGINIVRYSDGTTRKIYVK